MSDKPERHYETPRVLHDAPLRKGDLSHFHFDDFAVTLARPFGLPRLLRSRRPGRPRRFSGARVPIGFL